jgi:hypothetical protein
MNDRIDAFLDQDVIAILLRACARMRRPWIEGVYDLLVVEFGDDLQSDSFKRTLGKRARRTHEALGLRLDQTNVKTRYAPGFSRAARYRVA